MSEMCGCGRSVLDAYDRQPSDVQPWRDGRMQGEGATAYIPDDGERLVPVTERMAIQRPTSAELISAECDALKAMLLAKNAAYGDSALHPVRVFSRLSVADSLRVRLDDKLSRLRTAPDAFNEDALLDLLGYGVLLRVEMRRHDV
jgi:hypothetical protein